MELTARQRWLTLIVLCVAELLVSIDNTIVNVALPSLSRELGASTSGLQWIVDAYTLVFAGLLLAAGHAGDRLGRRRVLIVGMVGFGAVSAVAASVDSLGQLIGARAVMGAFAALIFPATLATITNVFTQARERAAAVGIWAGVAGIAVAVGPVSGGYLLEHFTWHSVFWVNVPIAVAAIVATALWVPESRNPNVGRLDVVGVLGSVAAIVTIVWTVIEGPRHGWVSPAGLIGAVGGVVLLAGFIAWESRHPHPVVNVRLFANRRFSAASGSIAIAFFGLFGFIFLVTQFFQAVKGYNTLNAGMRTLPFAIVIGLLSPVAMRLAHRLGSAIVVAAGLALMGAGFGLAAMTGRDSAYFGRIIIAMVLMAAGLALISGPATDAIMGALPLHEAGAGSAVNDTTREVGGTLGVAVLGSVLASSYAHDVHHALAGTPLPGAARSAVDSSVTAGVDAAAQLPDHTSATLVADAVKDSFMSGFHSASWVAAVACLVAAVIVVFVLPARAQQPTPSTTRDDELQLVETARP